MIELFKHKKSWQGTIFYGKSYGKFLNETLEFDFEIKKIEENYFEAISKDISGFGVNPTEAFIRGEINSNKISFVKKYRNDLMFDENEEFYLSEKESFPIIYKRLYDENSQTFEGDWKMKAKIYLLGIIPIPYNLKGTWKMH